MRTRTVALLVVIAFVAGLELGVRRAAPSVAVTASDNLVINVLRFDPTKQ